VEEVKALFPQYMSRVYEQAARRAVQALHPGYRVGRQWGKAGGKAYEIDVMAVGPRGDAIYGEVKWSEAVDCAGEKERLREKALPGLKAGRPLHIRQVVQAQGAGMPGPRRRGAHSGGKRYIARRDAAAEGRGGAAGGGPP